MLKRALYIVIPLILLVALLAIIILRYEVNRKTNALRKEITERTEAEDIAQKSEKKYIQLTENIETILWEYDITEDKWTYVSPQSVKILGYVPEEWTNLKFWTDHIHEDDRDWASAYCAACTAGGEAHNFEYRFFKKNGEIIWLRDVVNVEIHEGTPTKLRGFMSDITDNGNGLPEGFDISESKGFGLMLIKMLSRQLDGTFSIENNNGTKSTLVFSI